MTAQTKLQYITPVAELLNREFWADACSNEQLKSYILYQFQIREGFTGASWQTVIRYIPECDMNMDIRYVVDARKVVETIIKLINQ